MAKKPKAKWPKYGWMFRAVGGIYDFDFSRRKLMQKWGIADVERGEWLQRVEIRPAKGAKRAE